MTEVVNKSEIVDKWIEKKRAEAQGDDKPWPLAVTVQNETPADRYDTDQDYVDMFHALIDMASHQALKKLREAGRLREVRRLKLFVHNTKEDA